MEYLPLSFLAGILTILAPCVFLILPVVLGSTFITSSWKKPLTIITSLSISITIFTLILKVSTALIAVDDAVWEIISGGIIFLVGIFMLFPDSWEVLSHRLNFTNRANKLLARGSQKKSFYGDVITGIALGPVFSSCSPTYAVLVATVFPQNFFTGLVNILVYVFGLAITLLLISLFGQRIIVKLKWAVNPKGSFKRIISITFIILGLLVISGIYKDIETWLVENGVAFTSEFESDQINKIAS